ncbi:hypothetical protein [Herbiconiux daphne]|uniref:Uncharacterized protein n=1 Tax=Herbiconiux daphne TaxID=2970914 RepID=A0ABT2H1S0_9MICO|nr:hypothetical protein [Herbiconiux daphne]MCS5733870.1 hypothetical protein [Herbiconiux daphne]
MSGDGILMTVIAGVLVLLLLVGGLTFQKYLWKYIANYHTKPNKDGLDENYRIK